MTVKGFVAAATLVAVGTTAPAVAHSVVRFARNADHVDGIDAVRAHAGERAGKLVATNGRGRLPKAVIGTAPNAQRLGHHAAADYALTCLPGVVVGSAFVPADLGSTRTRVDAWQYVRSSNGGEIGCTLQNFLEARRTATGVYQVAFVTGRICDGGPPPQTYQTLVTVKSEEPLIATSRTVCDDGDWPVEEVRVFDSTGAPRDAAFTVTLLTHTAPLP